MVNQRKVAKNTWNKGLVMDFSPENTSDEVLTHALNATLLTYNGNELSLQNDQGNARVETAYLPEGYIPVGTCEYGGIIYIVSYNPIEDKSQIGCFPSPERNISNDELGIPDAIIPNVFQEMEDGSPTGKILQESYMVLLKNDNLNPGDKFLICSSRQIYNERLEDLQVDTGDGFKDVEHPLLRLRVVSISDDGKITYLDSSVRNYDVVISQDRQLSYRYFIIGSSDEDSFDQQAIDLDQYRNTLSSGFNVFKSKHSGKLGILAEIVKIDGFSVTHYLRSDSNGDLNVNLSFDVTPYLTKENFSTAPKLSNLYLQHSQGYLLAGQEKVPLFKEQDGQVLGQYNDKFFKTKLSEVFVEEANSGLLTSSVSEGSKFNFQSTNTYHSGTNFYNVPESGIIDKNVYSKFTEGKYHRIKKAQVYDNLSDYFINTLYAKFYYYDSDEEDYKIFTDQQLNEDYIYFIKQTSFVYKDAQREPKYQNVTLYKNQTVAIEADSNIIADTNIEKFQYIEIISFVEATILDFIEGKTLYIKSDNNTYEQFLGNPDFDNETYYIRVVETNLKSIGFVVNPSDYPGIIYYYGEEKDYIPATEEEVATYYDFETYPFEEEAPYGSPITLYWMDTVEEYVQATEEQLINFQEYTLYYISSYKQLSENEMSTFDDSMGQLFMVVPSDVYIYSDKFEPNINDNYIYGQQKPEGDYPLDHPIYLYGVSDFIPSNIENDINYLGYDDILFAKVRLPEVVRKHELGFPFVYNYTITPCMSYGRLDNLTISNTIDFSKVYDFGASDFKIWKYKIEQGFVRLTFGADVYDTFEDSQVDGLVLEFYDCRGFAGSIQIENRKGYSGIFQQVIPLNQLNALSTKKIEGNGYRETFSHNINILKKGDNYVYNSQRVAFSSSSGWYYLDDIKSDPIPNRVLKGENNDCGVLYSNVLYGVKTYLRRPSPDGGHEFIPKKEFFMYTFPIFNDYYKSVDNFNNIENPQLNFGITYKLINSGNKQVYNGENIEEGYNEEDKQIINDCYLGKYDGTDAQVTKYYKFDGTTQLQLEIGLTKEYELINLKNLAEINQYYSCQLELQGDNDIFDIKSSQLEDGSAFVNYTYDDKEKNLHFNEGGNVIDIPTGSFDDYNFTEQQNPSSININYNFIIGYNANITNITKTDVPSTTVCALCHQNNGEYNYSDFGISEEVATGTDCVYYSDSIITIGGAQHDARLGISKQIKYKSSEQEPGVDTTADYLFKYTEYVNNWDPNIKGDIFSSNYECITNNIGKLQFIAPFYFKATANEGKDSSYGPSIREPEREEGSEEYKYSIMIPSMQNITIDNKQEVTSGILGSHRQFYYPLITCSLITQSFVKGGQLSVMSPKVQYNENDDVYIPLFNLDGDFIHGTIKEGGIRFYGFNYRYLCRFNRYLMRTMKQVYAYNPDYDTMSVNKGNVEIQDYKIKFASNILCRNSKFTFPKGKTLNDYFCIGTIIFSNYLSELNRYSGISIADSEGNTLKTLQFIPNFKYCGTTENPYLLTSLTYNTPLPQEMVDELNFNLYDTVVVRQHNGNIKFIKGELNKNLLYGYEKDNNVLIQLNYANYIIKDENWDFDDVGNIQLKLDENLKNQIYYVDEIPYDQCYELDRDDYDKINVSIGGEKEYDTSYTSYVYYIDYYKSIVGTHLTLCDLIYRPNSEHKLFVKPDRIKPSNNYIYLRNNCLEDPNYLENYYDDEVQGKTTNKVRLNIGPSFTTITDVSSNDIP